MLCGLLYCTKSYLWQYSGNRRPQILSSRAACWPALIHSKWCCSLGGTVRTVFRKLRHCNTEWRFRATTVCCCQLLLSSVTNCQRISYARKKFEVVKAVEIHTLCSGLQYRWVLWLRLKCDGTCAETRFSLSGETDRVHLNRPGGVSSVDYWPAEVCASAVVMLDTPCSEVVWRVLATHCIRQSI